MVQVPEKLVPLLVLLNNIKNKLKNIIQKIFVLVPGTNIKENFKKELLFCTGSTYLKNKELLEQMTNDEIEKNEKLVYLVLFNIIKLCHIKLFIEKF